MAAKMRFIIKDGVQGIPEKIRTKFQIRMDAMYIYIGETVTINPNSIIKVLKSSDDYEIQTKGAIVNLSLNDYKVRTLIR